VKKEIIFENLTNPLLFFGENDTNIKMLEKEFDVQVFSRGNEVKITGSDEKVLLTEKALFHLFNLSEKGRVSYDELMFIIKNLKEKPELKPEDIDTRSIIVSRTGKKLQLKNYKQSEYIKAVQENDVVFCIGPAGTGKTYLAVAMAINALVSENKNRIILTRPVVEAGESLGYLPGDMVAKINPYLRPLLDALTEMLPYEEYSRYREREQIEIAPLAYMRGRTLNNSFIILDEAQNTTVTQLKMFLTRMGPASKIVVTGDITQIDLPRRIESGLEFAAKYLKNIDGIGFVRFNKRDIIRHRLVKKIIEVFEERESQNNVPEK
jgi:phosphate starvation-inducible PhoH-like protein